MENFEVLAIRKLEEEKKAVSGNKEKAMSAAVLAVIKDFCGQNEEFAEAVAEGRSFADCMKKVADGVGASISDFDAYKKAVQFYFPGARVHMQMTIDTGERKEYPAVTPVRVNQEAQKCNGKLIRLNLEDFF